MLLVLGTILLCSCATQSPVQRPPEIGGQIVPDNNVVIDFRKSYNVFWRDGDTIAMIPNAKIIGYTGDTARDTTGSYTRKYSSFGSWLVIDPKGTGRIFMPHGMIAYLQESR